MTAGNVSISFEESMRLLKPENRPELRERAHEATMRFAPRVFDFCAIVNAKSGRCSEDCRWCAQSAHWKTLCAQYGWVGEKTCVEAALDAERKGAVRIGIVTSGRGGAALDIDAVCDAIRAMKSATRLHICASLGILDLASLKKLQAAGLERVHCNIETAPSAFHRYCTTHTAEEKIATINAARSIGLQVCSGGILGMGESDRELVEFAFALKEIAPDSIPLNFLHPIPGTPLGELPVPDPERVVDSVAIVRLVTPATSLRFAGGRSDMSDDTARKCIYVGMCAGIAGHLLTTPGADYDDDRALAIEAGLRVE